MSTNKKQVEKETGNVLSKGHRLTEKEAKEIVKKYKSGKYTQHELAKKYGCSYGKIWLVVGSGKNYAERVAEHGGPLRAEPEKKGKKATAKAAPKKESALAAIKKGKGKK
jgi:hypothetical protein